MIAAAYQFETHDAARRRIIAETEAALEFALQDGVSIPHIPTVEVGRGGFDRTFAEQFWRRVLDLDTETPKLLKIFRAGRGMWNRGGLN